MSAELYATYDAYRAVSSGTPFRDAYKSTAEKVGSGELDVESLKSDFDSIWRRILSHMHEAKVELKGFSSKLEKSASRLADLEKSIFS